MNEEKVTANPVIPREWYAEQGHPDLAELHPVQQYHLKAHVGYSPKPGVYARFEAIANHPVLARLERGLALEAPEDHNFAAIEALVAVMEHTDDADLRQEAARTIYFYVGFLPDVYQGQRLSELVEAVHENCGWREQT